MKQCLLLLPLLMLLPSCKDDASAKAPKAVEVKEVVVVKTPAPEGFVIEDPAPAEGAVVIEKVPADGVVVVDPTAPAVPPKTPGEHLDHALQKTGEGFQTAGEKTEHGLKVAREKTEAGLETAAEKTGGFLKRVGEKIEDAGKKGEEP